MTNDPHRRSSPPRSVFGAGKASLSGRRCGAGLHPARDGSSIAEGNLPLERVPDSDFFEWRGSGKNLPEHYRLIWRDTWHHDHIAHDPYSYLPQIPRFRPAPVRRGQAQPRLRFLGANEHEVDGVAGILFAVWAPNAERVSVLGDFNHWDGRRHPMRVRPGSGVWELFIPDIAAGIFYRFEIRNRNSGEVLTKSDPYGRRFEMRPGNASIVAPRSTYVWQDAAWIERRAAPTGSMRRCPPTRSISVPGSAATKGSSSTTANWRDQLVEYVADMGFTHIELLPVTEHPFDQSWGYQVTGYFAPTSRFGTPTISATSSTTATRTDRRDSRLGAGAFPQGCPRRWRASTARRSTSTRIRARASTSTGTLIFNFGRNEVKNFLCPAPCTGLTSSTSTACGSMPSRRCSTSTIRAPNGCPTSTAAARNRGDRLPARAQRHDAQRSARHAGHRRGITSWPQVTRPTYLGGLGFSIKWNMGWMNDTLRYMGRTRSTASTIMTC
jgi:1,4-alpha-glucan branching enzyme